MRRLKLSVALLFILVAAALFGRQFFTTVSAGGNLGAPSGISASDGDYIDKVNVIWNAVRGATLYRIFRNTSNNSSTATDVGTTQANYFFDTTAQTGQTYFYWVRAENGVSIGDLSNGDQGVRVTGSFHSQFFAPLGPPPTVAGNQITAAKTSFGKTLFWDEQLSSTWTVSCGTCHRPSAGGSDPRTNSNTRNPGFDGVFNTADDVFGSPGVPLNNADGTYSPSSIYGFGEQVTSRKSPTYLNAGVTFNGSFWDGRASTVFRDPLTNQILLNDWGALESQAIVPPLSDAEMAHSNRNWTQISEQLSSVKPLALAENVPPSLIEWIDGRNYNELFQEAFGTPEITPSRIALAIAAHERTIISDRAPIDRYSANIESLTAQEDRGRVVFEQNDCTFCHSGPVLSNQNFHYIGVRPQIEDKGRGNVTGNSNDNGRFKSPSLRNLELRAPYMHNGRFATIEEVVEFYNRGGDFTAANKDPRVRPLGLSVQQRADLVAFLKRPMTDLRVKDELPPFDRPRLFTESSRVPQITGTGRAGTGAIVPQVMAIEPPILGNPSFTVAVSKGLGNAQAVLVIDSNDPGVGASIPSNGSFVRVGVDISSGGFASVSLPIPNNPALIGQTFFGRWYVTDADAENGFSVSQAFRFTIFGEQSAPNRAAFIDFDGDNKTDISIFRPSNGQWWHLRSSDGQNRAYQFGTTSDKIVPADFTGDGKIDTAFWRPSSGEWFILRSEDF
ncbi:MAG TPA: cytochrome c peroxidase, partial [Pyrinomonadaceae bacterium]|nr:cytochrome c peroxidase [Pyrinomonadaceae bacterium]